MVQFLINFFSSFPHELATFLMAMTPVGELRLALPVAVAVYKLPVWEALFWSVLGNMVPVTIILMFANRFHSWVHKKSGFFAISWLKQLHRAQEKFKDYEKYGLLGLMIFVGVPLPMTGAWTGALIAFLLGVPIRHSWPYLLGGVIISALITLAVTMGAIRIF
ncbi:MAG: hypothetical protein UX39_C0004G0006 [Candidatus Magasanikbacteria bacterium GW2011_GWA2_46_17]|uniref:Small multi-drug export protein n=1 Tax=Candidatus Magasanikbacteria bacterium GW2011_GWA2_46_17 TaxID=1619042 RepID=A0A0G1RAU2_9BACT|nr:MAG: hypothetical protein UX39_C0004G0006 [Candidatus Magasanikbacteria bacterium GW2011_GWA2_46_17]